MKGLFFSKNIQFQTQKKPKFISDCFPKNAENYEFSNKTERS